MLTNQCFWIPIGAWPAIAHPRPYLIVILPLEGISCCFPYLILTEPVGLGPFSRMQPPFTIQTDLPINSIFPHHLLLDWHPAWHLVFPAHFLSSDATTSSDDSIWQFRSMYCFSFFIFEMVQTIKYIPLYIYIIRLDPLFLGMFNPVSFPLSTSDLFVFFYLFFYIASGLYLNKDYSYPFHLAHLGLLLCKY